MPGALHKILFAVCVIYVLIAGGLFLVQRSLIYPAPKEQAPLPAGFERVAVTTEDGLQLTFAHRPAAPGKPTAVFFHGNGDNWAGGAAATQAIAGSGFGVLLAEYRGYAGNPGSPGEIGLYRDGRAAIEWLGGAGVSRNELIITGNSVGSGVAVQMAQEYQPAALVLLSPFDSLAGLIGEKFFWLPARWLVRDRFDNLAKISDIESPILIQHGSVDDLIPVDHGQRLSTAAPHAQFQPFTGVGHELAYLAEPQHAQLLWLKSVLSD